MAHGTINIQEPHREGQFDRVGASPMAWMAARQYRVARVSQGCPATAGSYAATRCPQVFSSSVSSSEKPSSGDALRRARLRPCGPLIYGMSAA